MATCQAARRGGQRLAKRAAVDQSDVSETLVMRQDAASTVAASCRSGVIGSDRRP